MSDGIRTRDRRDHNPTNPSIAYQHTPEPDIGLDTHVEHAIALPRLLARLTQRDDERELDPDITR